MKHHNQQQQRPAPKPSHEVVAKKAYTIYLNEGCPDGRDLENWLQAENEERTMLSNDGKQELPKSGSHDENRYKV